MFDTVAEAIQKIQGTVVMKGTDPVQIIEIGGRDGRVNALYRPLDNQDMKTSPLADKDWDVASLGNRLGYINLRHRGNDTSVYSRRAHIRRSHQTQGLHNTNVFVDAVKPNNRLGIIPYAYNFSTLVDNNLRLTMKDEFPSLSSVRYKMGRDQTIAEMAFDKFLSVSRDKPDLFKLNYKGNEIGWSDDLDTFRVLKEWRYLDGRFADHSMKVR